MRLNIYPTKQKVAEQFALYFFDFVKTKNIVHIALSGGSTPKIVFDELAKNYADKIHWEHIHFYWGDERCVPPTDEDSNYGMTIEHLFSKIEIPEDNVHRILGEKEPQREAFRYANLLEINLDRVNGVPQFDLVVLGMGDDGHTASIFPHEIELWNSNDHCAVATHPGTGQKRITITGQVINAAKEVAFLVTGSNKAKKVGEIVDKKDGYKKYPAGLVMPKSENQLWFLDASAATDITSGQS